MSIENPLDQQLQPKQVTQNDPPMSIQQREQHETHIFTQQQEQNIFQIGSLVLRTNEAHPKNLEHDESPP